MVTEGQYSAVMAENAALRAQMRVALGRIAALGARISELEARKTTPPAS
jgi:hypothetical protein